MNYDLQIALVQDLLSDTNLRTLVGVKVFDHVPQGTLYPYIQVGDLTWTDLGEMTSPGNEVTFTLHMWSQQRGKREVEQMQQIVWTRWHERAGLTIGQSTLPMATYLSVFRHVFSKVMTENDGLTRHGIATYRLITSGS